MEAIVFGGATVDPGPLAQYIKSTINNNNNKLGSNMKFGSYMRMLLNVASFNWGTWLK